MSIIWRAAPYVLKSIVEYVAESAFGHLFDRFSASSTTATATTTMLPPSSAARGGVPTLARRSGKRGCAGRLSSASGLFVSLVMRLGMAWIVAGTSFLFVAGKEAWDATMTDVRTAYLGVSNGKCDSDMTAAQRATCDAYANTLNSYFAVLLARNFITGAVEHATTFAGNVWVWINDSTIGWAIWTALVLVVLIFITRFVLWVSSLFTLAAQHASVRSFNAQQEAFYRSASPELKGILNTPNRFCAAPTPVPMAYAAYAADESNDDGEHEDFYDTTAAPHA